MSFLSSLFGWLEDLLRDIWKAFKIVLPYIALALALWVGVVGALPLTWLGVSMIIPAGWVSALFFMGTSYLLAPEETTAVVSGAVEAIGDSVTAVVVAAGTTVGAGIGAIADASGISTWLIVGGLGVAAYLLLSNSNRDRNQSESLGGGNQGTADKPNFSEKGDALNA